MFAIRGESFGFKFGFGSAEDTVSVSVSVSGSSEARPRDRQREREREREKYLVPKHGHDRRDFDTRRCDPVVPSTLDVMPEQVFLVRVLQLRRLTDEVHHDQEFLPRHLDEPDGDDVGVMLQFDTEERFVTHGTEHNYAHVPCHRVEFSTLGRRE